MKLEQAASIKEEIGRKLSEKVDKLEFTIADMENNFDKLSRENGHKEDLIQLVLTSKSLK